MNRRLLIAITVVIVAIASIQIQMSGPDTEADSIEGDFLLDYGNGRITWIDRMDGETVGAAIKTSLTSSSIVFDEELTTVDGVENATVGSSTGDGSLSKPGTTGVTSYCSWTAYVWIDYEWSSVKLDSPYNGERLALAFYPEGILPVCTPDNKSSMTALQKDSWNSANQTTNLSEETGEAWSIVPKRGLEPSGLYGGVLTARDYVILKYGEPAGGLASVKCYKISTQEEVWSFDYPPQKMDTTSALIVGQYVYVGGNNGHIYKFDWREGPGEGNKNVTTLFGKAWDDPDAVVPEKTIDIDWYVSWISYTSSMVADSGAIYVKSYNGMTYCFDLDLNLLWSAQMEGHTYYSTPTVFDGYVFSGCYDGTLYVFNQYTGEFVAKQIVYQTVDFKGKCGAAQTPQIFKNGDGNYTVFVTCSDGLGMDSKYSSLVVYRFDGTTFTEIKNFKQSLGSTGAFLTRYVTDEFTGVIAAFDSGLYTIDLEGNYKLLSDYVSDHYLIHNTPQLVNGKLLFMNTYSSKNAISLDLETGREGMMSGLSSNSMAPPAIIDGLVFCPDDTGLHVYYSTFEEYVPPTPVPTDNGIWKILLYVLIGLAILLIALWLILRFAFKWEKPFEELKMHILHFFFGEEYTHNTRSKRKVRTVFVVGIIMTVIISLISLCFGSETTLSLPDAISNMISSIQKGGHNLTYEEMLIYNQRLPRVLAAIGVGVGLSVAGAMYQAIIKNPLVEPYIMGVSSGAGTFAVAVITFNFTFFGLFAAGSMYLTAFSAIFGGLFAFGLTMLLALKTGGKSINYVLAGIVIGLVFSAVQSLLMINAGTKVSSALSWLYGSFSTISWDQVWLVLIPAISLSLIPLIWAKEFNLILLGDDQAKQMGLNVKRFNTIMLIVASVLTSFCVAFCGIIGFVGLVIPHLSRMILGGDHRLMLPATMAFGGFLMVAADLLARVLLSGYELPVGAITTCIGVPVFAYLLIKRGRSYDV